MQEPRFVAPLGSLELASACHSRMVAVAPTLGVSLLGMGRSRPVERTGSTLFPGSYLLANSLLATVEIASCSSVMPLASLPCQ